MAKQFDIDSPDDVFDSRDAIERFEELESDHTDLQDAIDKAAGNLEDADYELNDARDDVNATEAKDPDAIARRDAAEKAHDEASDKLKAAERAMEEWTDAEEYEKLKKFVDECDKSVSDFSHGATFVADDHFEEYAQELAEDIGAIKRDMEWPCNCIDWKKAADLLKQDYQEVDVNGATFWVRN